MSVISITDRTGKDSGIFKDGDLEVFLRRFINDIEKNKYNKDETCWFNMSKIRWIDLFEVACLIVCAAHLKQRNVCSGFKFFIPEDPDSKKEKYKTSKKLERNEEQERGTWKALDFLKQFRFVDCINQKFEIEPNSKDIEGIPIIKNYDNAIALNARFVENIDDERKALADLRNNLERRFGPKVIEPKAINKFCDYITQELLINICEHAYRDVSVESEDKIGIISVKTRRLESEKKIPEEIWRMGLNDAPEWYQGYMKALKSPTAFWETVIADGGSGIPYTIRKQEEEKTDKFCFMSDIDLIKLPLNNPLKFPLETMKNEGGIERKGLYIVNDTMKELGGCIRVRSGHCAITYCYPEPNSERLEWEQTNLAELDGTQIQVLIPIKYK